LYLQEHRASILGLYVKRHWLGHQRQAETLLLSLASQVEAELAAERERAARAGEAARAAIAAKEAELAQLEAARKAAVGG
jgi:hypothetical protein